jgi:hypothetical protein
MKTLRSKLTLSAPTAGNPSIDIQGPYAFSSETSEAVNDTAANGGYEFSNSSGTREINVDVIVRDPTFSSE